MKLNFGVIVNLNAGKNRRSAQQGVDVERRLQNIVGDTGLIYPAKDVHDLSKIAERFRERGVEILAISGGDGTVHYVLTAFWHVYGWEIVKLKLLLLRGGTMNNLANSLGVIKIGQEDFLERIVRKIKEGERIYSTDWYTLRINHELGNFFGLGIISNFLDLYYGRDFKGKPSPVKAAKLLAAGIGSIIMGGDLSKKITQWVEAEIEIEGRRYFKNDYSVIAAGTAESLGLGTKPLPRAREIPGYFQFVGLALSPISIVWRVPRFYLGLEVREKYGQVINCLANEAVIKTIKPYKFTIDGEMKEGLSEFWLRTGPRMEVIMG